MPVWISVLLLAQASTPDAVFQRAAQSLAQGDLPAAERDLQTVLARAPNHFGALGNLGIVYARTGRLPEAVSVYQRALKLSPNQPGLLLNLSLAHLQLDEHAKAKPLLTRLASLGKPSPQVRELLATAQLFTGETAQALATLEALNREDPASAGVLYLMALAYLRQNDRATAEVAFGNLMKTLSPDQAHLLAGKAYYETSMFEEAERELKQARGAHLELGKTYASLRRQDDAIRELRAALAAAPFDVEAQYFLGALLLQDPSSYTEAARLLSEVERRRPDSWGAAYYLGRLHLIQQRPAEALRLLEKAARLNPTEAAVWVQLATAYRAAGRSEDARRTAARVTALRSAANPPLVLK